MIRTSSWALAFLLGGPLLGCAATPDAVSPDPVKQARVATTAAKPADGATALDVPQVAAPVDLTSIEIKASRPVVAAGKEESVVVRVRVKGLPLVDKKRPPMNIALVVDASGSMEGAGIDEARKACAAVVDQLQEGDALSVVTFGSQPKVVVEATRVSPTSKAAAKKAIAEIKAAGTTDMAGGLRAGIEQAKAMIDLKGINRVVLVGDGVPNDPALLPGLADQARSLRLPITSLGLGPEFDETQMSLLAQRSGGSFHFVENGDRVVSVFKSEIARMERLVAKNTRVELTPGPGVTIEEAIGLQGSRNGRKLVVQLGDLTEGQARDVLVKVKLAGHADGTKVELLDALAHYTPAAGGIERNVAEFAALKSSSNGESLREVNRDVEHQATRLRVADAIVKAMAQARVGDVPGARKILDAASKLATEGAKKFEDADLTAKAKEIAALKKTIASLAPAVQLGAAGGAPRAAMDMAQPAPVSLAMRKSHGRAMSELQGDVE
jgi:Ca-activated chloride channel homolog